LTGVSVVIPTYRGESSIGELVTRVGRVLEQRGDDYEIVVVNDASPDGTWDELAEMARLDFRVIAIDLLSNHGQPAATMCGLAHSSGTIVVTMDDDLQQPPEEIPVLLDALDSHPEWDAVVGCWPRDGGALRNLGSRMHAAADRVAWSTRTGFHHTAFRAIRRPAVDALVAHGTRSPVVGPMLTRVATEVHNVEVRHAERPYGSSNFRFTAGIKRALTNFGHGSVAPLHALTFFGLAVAVVSLVLAAVLIVRWVVDGNDAPAGWLSVFVATLFFGGTTLLGLGIVGQYIQLIVREVRHQPRWSIREIAQSPRTWGRVEEGRSESSNGDDLQRSIQRSVPHP